MIKNNLEKKSNNLAPKDKKILFAVGTNAELSFSDIEKITRIPRTVVKKRLLRLEERNIINAYKLNVNYKLLGFEEYEVYLRLMGVDEKKKRNIVETLTKNKNVSWVGLCFGNYDIKMSFYAKDNQQFYGIFADALTGFREYVKAQEVVSVTKKYKMDKTLFLDSVLKENLGIRPKQKTKTTPRLKLKPGQPALDPTDKTIIRLLGNNPRSKLVALSAKTGLTAQGVKNRIDSLKERQIILGSNALINGQILGFVWSTCLFKLTLAEDDEEELEKYILHMSGTTSAVRLLGKWDLGITFFSESIEDLQHKVNGFKGAFKDCIKDYDSLIVLESHKYPSIPECAFE